MERLSAEAAKWVAENPKLATDYILVSRPKEWDVNVKEPKHYPSKKKSNDTRL